MVCEVKESPYRFKDGYRIVPPYEYLYKSFVKERWMGKSVHKVLLSEFAALSEDYIQHACKNGKFKLYSKNGEELCKDSSVLDHILKPNEKLCHYAVVHEQLALDKPVRLIKNLEDYIVVSKPTSVPVYHTGTYHYNTLVEIMKYELPECENLRLYPIHRIDKLVSGVVVFAKSSNAASKFSQAIKELLVKKVYVARVCGDFRNINSNLVTLKDDYIISHGFMYALSKRDGKHEFTMECINSKCKPVETRFKFLSYNSDLDESLILCYPVTGRTHQIRAHLKHLGYSISNDQCYNNGRIVDSEEYFKSIPDVRWESDSEGNWCIPELSFTTTVPSVDTAQCGGIPFVDLTTTQDDGGFHVGLNREGNTSRKNPTGIFLHSFRYMWKDKFNVYDQFPSWTKEFDVSCDITSINLWDDYLYVLVPSLYVKICLTYHVN
ncbi:RNA pseudouridylate synthase, putative [Theileria equi strain WA]|uniref:RNA pseudouridylate synthase, putative n=1 Tax=Theileria equi strain WA TaxID=1537102 RepID=L1LFH2_THEEQ|nr:RNA pseudouridylate synthase, putative [Theileria equi strain WA]EKX74182.1 RNA pseudouridylate synthase, putative [Theileria equi strain WA]|eukprot:XP_004833634.1 RNA pseudouridylate synthase, putative [Theileria equi strain WA]